MIGRLVILALLVACAGSKPAETQSPEAPLSADQRAEVIKLATAFEAEVDRRNWCDTTTMHLARKIDRFGALGWEIAEAVFADPSLASRTREALEHDRAFRASIQARMRAAQQALAADAAPQRR